MNTAPTFTASNLNGATTQKTGAVVQAPKTGNIHKIHFLTGTVTTPTDTDIRIETIASTGLPTGTLWGTNTNVTLLSGSITANTWTTVTLTADAAVNQGDNFAIVIFPSGLPVYQILSIVTGYELGFPYRVSSNAGTYSSIVSSNTIGVEYSDGSFAYMPNVVPAKAINTHTIASNTTPDEIALKFQLPFSARVTGAWAWQTRGAAATFKTILYDSDGSTVLGFSPTTIGGFTTGRVRVVRFPSSVTLLASTDYFLSVQPQSTTSLDVYSIDVNAANLLDQMEGGQNFRYADRTDVGAWSETATRRPYIGLIIDGIDIPSGGGTVLFNILD